MSYQLYLMRTISNGDEINHLPYRHIVLHSNPCQWCQPDHRDTAHTADNSCILERIPRSEDHRTLHGSNSHLQTGTHNFVRPRNQQDIVRPRNPAGLVRSRNEADIVSMYSIQANLRETSHYFQLIGKSYILAAIVKTTQVQIYMHIYVYIYIYIHIR